MEAQGYSDTSLASLEVKLTPFLYDAKLHGGAAIYTVRTLTETVLCNMTIWVHCFHTLSAMQHWTMYR